MPTREDFIGQNNPNIQIYAADHGLIPEYVDDSPMITEEDLKGLDNTAFANPYLRTFPCHTKVACVQSALWDAANNHGNELVTGNIKKMAAAHGITEEVEKIYTHFQDAFTKAAAARDEEEEANRTFALKLQHETGHISNYFETTYPQDVAHSAEEADREFRAGNIGEREFRKIASDIMSSAQRHKMATAEFPRTIRTFGTTRLPDPYMGELAVREFCKRSHVDPEPYVKEVEDLQGAMAEATDIDEAIKMANYVADKLVQLNLDNAIVPTMENSPYVLIFNGPERDEFDKRAASTVYILDVPVPMNALASLPDDVIDAHFASSSAGRIKEAQAVLGQEDMNKAAQAAEIISQMTPQAREHLLRTLAKLGRE